LTVGKPALVGLEPHNVAREAVLELAAAVQSGSEHPLARAVVTAAGGYAAAKARDVRAVPGRGVEGIVAGHRVAIGSSRWMRELGVDIDALADKADEFARQGYSVSWIADLTDRPALLGVMAFGDAPRPEAAEAVAQLKQRGIRTVVLTGDNRAAAEAIGAKLGIDEVRAEVLPADKAEAMSSLGKTYRTAMVGDGVNDAPALAAARLGIAMGSGTDVAMHAAGVTLMRPDPRLVGAAIDISRRTYAKIRQNLFWAFVYNVVGIPLAALGILTPVIAGAAMALSSVSVVANALLLKRWKPEE
jgi:Cu+-exporting ATPase